MKKTLIILACLVIAAICYFTIKHFQHAQTTAATVSVSRGTIIEKVTAVGSILPIKTAAVKSPISGTVAILFHHEGDYVTKGEKLIAIKPDPTPQEYITDSEQVQMDLTKVKKDQQDVQRYHYLLKQGAISPHDQDYAAAQEVLHTDQLQLILDQQKLSLLKQGKAMIGKLQIANIISSPANGYIVQRNVNIGDPVTAQTDYQAGNELLIIADMSQMIFKGQVSEIDAAKLHVGMPANIQIAAFPNQIIKGTLKKLSLESAQIDTANGDDYYGSTSSSTGSSGSSNPFSVGFNVEIAITQIPPQIKLRAGYSATADISVDRAVNALMLPERVIQFDNQNPYVLLPNGNHAPKKQYISTGLSDGMEVAITKGLTLNEKVLDNIVKNNSDDSDND